MAIMSFKELTENILVGATITVLAVFGIGLNNKLESINNRTDRLMNSLELAASNINKASGLISTAIDDDTLNNLQTSVKKLNGVLGKIDSALPQETIRDVRQAIHNLQQVSTTLNNRALSPESMANLQQSIATVNNALAVVNNGIVDGRTVTGALMRQTPNAEQQATARALAEQHESGSNAHAVPAGRRNSCAIT